MPCPAGASIGIPCIVAADGCVSFYTASFVASGIADGASCSIDGKGC